MAQSAAFRVGGLAGLLTVLSLLVAPGLDPRPAAAQGPSTHIVARYAQNCLEGHFWPGPQVNIEVKDSGGNPIYTDTVPTDPSGSFIAHIKADRVFCDIPISLSPGMTYTATDLTSTRTLVIESLTFDQLDPEAETAAGTASAGRTGKVQVFTFNTGGPPEGFGPAFAVPVAGDAWSADLGAIGVDVQPDSLGGAFLPDPTDTGQVDFTTASIFVTSLSLTASPAGGGASSAIAQAAGAGVVRRGARVRLSGRLSAARTQACAARRRVRLQKLVGKRSKVLESGRTNKKGRYSFVRKVERTTRFRVRYPGDRVCQRSTSRVKTVRVART